jgi:hypothetical protein
MNWRTIRYLAPMIDSARNEVKGELTGQRRRSDPTNLDKAGIFLADTCGWFLNRFKTI